MKPVKKIMSICLLLALSWPCAAGPTLKMLADSTPGYSLEILEQGFAGYSAGTVLNDFTFCVETNEHFSPGASYYAVAVLDDKANRNGLGGAPDPLDAHSAFLYTKFISGDADFQDQDNLQKAIWYIEQDFGGVNNSYVAAANSAINDPDPLSRWFAIGNVRIANLYNNYSNGVYSGLAQDQLMMITPVPVPGAILLGSLGLVIVGTLRRRKGLLVEI